MSLRMTYFVLRRFLFGTQILKWWRLERHSVLRSRESGLRGQGGVVIGKTNFRPFKIIIDEAA